jgi:hypothetical protein
MIVPPWNYGFVPGIETHKAPTDASRAIGDVFFEGWLRRGDVVKPTMRAHDRRRRAPTGAADA